MEEGEFEKTRQEAQFQSLRTISPFWVTMGSACVIMHFDECANENSALESAEALYCTTAASTLLTTA